MHTTLRRDTIFDRTGTIRRPSQWRHLREMASLLFYWPGAPDHSALPKGDGHVVLVIPAFLTTDAMTRPVRRLLARLGYRPFGSALGLNWGPTPSLLARLRRRLAELRALEGGPISVIGASLGGIMARDLAYDRPEDIRQVITLASPVRFPTASTIEPIFDLSTRFYSPSIDLARFAAPLPVPSTAIYTRDDGIVAWETCRRDDEGATAVEVTGAHVTICRNPQALRAVAERLAVHGSSVSQPA